LFFRRISPHSEIHSGKNDCGSLDMELLLYFSASASFSK
jgi:hypothetical protein